MACLTQHRFENAKYKNWLKTTMSLQLLRSSLEDFLENETETFHSRLRSKLEERVCESRPPCDSRGCGPQRTKAPQMCAACTDWKNEILSNHSSGKGIIYWNNCKPHLWSSQKWEVAKVYMPRGNKNHNNVKQFDISAILNFMKFCSHFKPMVKSDILDKVTNVRNQMMHSVDMKVPTEDMLEHQNKILELIQQLQAHVQLPELAMVEKEIKELQEMEFNIVFGELELSSGIRSEGNVCGPEFLHTLLNAQKVQDLEQQVLKEKIEFLASRLEEDGDLLASHEELCAMKAFLDQNKDLLEQLRPQVAKLDFIEKKVEQHDQQLSILAVKLDSLEKKTDETQYSAETVRFKNHLLELAQKNRWPTPIFHEIREPKGFKGVVVVNGQRFTGVLVHSKTKSAHQEVARLALESLPQQPCPEDQSSGPTPMDLVQSETTSSTTAPVFFSSVTVVLNTEVTLSEEDCGQGNAVEAIYKKLAVMFGLEVSAAGGSFKQKVQEYFTQAGFTQPEEILQTSPDGKINCKLKIFGPFTFQCQDAATKKKLAEQQAAKVALTQLAGVLGWDCATEDNYKGTLQELLERNGMDKPSYNGLPKDSGTPGDTTAIAPVLPSAASPQRSHIDSLQQKLKEEPVTQPVSQPPAMSSASRLFFVRATVSLKKVFDPYETHSKKEQAVKGAYKKLSVAFGLADPTSAASCTSAKKVVHEFFTKADWQLPEEMCEGPVDGSFTCKLDISGDFTFHNQEGASKKQQAEQGAAKEALCRLAGVLEWDPVCMDGNYKGRLQELLMKQGQQIPVYQQVSEHCAATPVPGCQASENSRAGGDVSQPESALDYVPIATQIAQPSELPPHNKMPRIESPELQKLLEVLGLRPPQVNSHVSVEKMFEYTVSVPLAGLLVTAQEASGSKKEAIRKSYLKLGQGLGLCEAEETKATMIVKEHLKQLSYSLPTEEFSETAGKMFFCHLGVACYTLTSAGKGPCEDSAKHEASKKALAQLAHLFDWDLVAKVADGDDAVGRITTLLQGAQQKQPTFLPTSTLHKASAELHFNTFSLESKGRANVSKKSTRNAISARMLGLLGERAELDTSNSYRNMVQEWFDQRGLERPRYEDTQEQFGAKVTFSATLECSPSDWQPSWEEADKRLAEEVQARLKYLVEEGNEKSL
ncbi:uncharacterized protein LOC136751338 isoform X2 [Amia ocellicauda]|uniref:uncharacterized protein LOC136751338 isoform X2 n=1 Tax=Amia ocellicauda TaxID=2972642 RepID=UPI0034643343